MRETVSVGKEWSWSASDRVAVGDRVIVTMPPLAGTTGVIERPARLLWRRAWMVRLDTGGPIRRTRVAGRGLERLSRADGTWDPEWLPLGHPLNTEPLPSIDSVDLAEGEKLLAELRANHSDRPLDGPGVLFATTHRLLFVPSAPLGIGRTRWEHPWAGVADIRPGQVKPYGNAPPFPILVVETTDDDTEIFFVASPTRDADNLTRLRPAGAEG